MISVVRLTLVSHASTDAVRAARFPADEGIDAVGRRDAGLAAPLSAKRVVAAPERRAAETAAALGLEPEIDSALRDLDHGAWRGLTMDEIDPVPLHEWLGDPASKPHGGESITELVDRVRGWLAGVAESGTGTIAITHPAIVRAAIVVALDAPPKSLWRIDVGPLSVTRLHHRGGAWTLRSTGDQPKSTP